jgi:hypothetical protein
LPANIESSKVYKIECDAVGDYIKIVTGRNSIDQKLSFANVEVYAKVKKLNKFEI